MNPFARVVGNVIPTTSWVCSIHKSVQSSCFVCTFSGALFAERARSVRSVRILRAWKVTLAVNQVHASSSKAGVIRVVLADDECLFRASLRQLLSVPPSVIKDVYGVDVGAGFEVIGEAGTGEETVAVIARTRPDLLLLDLSMPRMSGLEALRAVGPCDDSLRTILLAGISEPSY